MEILNDFTMPTQSSKGGSKNSRYLTADQQIIVNKLTVGQAVILPFTPDVTPQYQKSNVIWYAKKYCNPDGSKTFAAAIVDGKGIALKLVTQQVKQQPAEQLANKQPANKQQPAEQPAE